MVSNKPSVKAIFLKAYYSPKFKKMKLLAFLTCIIGIVGFIGISYCQITFPKEEMMPRLLFWYIELMTIAAILLSIYILKKEGEKCW
jgi:hypothetical protein